MSYMSQLEETYRSSEFYTEAREMMSRAERIDALKVNLMIDCTKEIEEYKQKDEDTDGVYYVAVVYHYGYPEATIAQGDFVHCRLEKYEHDVKTIDDEYQIVKIERIEYESKDELESKLEGYRELAYLNTDEL